MIWTTYGQQPEDFVSEAATVTPQAKKKRRFGRPDVPRPLAGLDMRTQEGKLFLSRLQEVEKEFPYGEPARHREIAGLRVALEQCQVETLRGSQPARVDLVRISNLIARREGELRTRKATAAPAPAPLALQQYLARLSAQRQAAPATIAPPPPASAASDAPGHDDEGGE